MQTIYEQFDEALNNIIYTKDSRSGTAYQVLIKDRIFISCNGKSSWKTKFSALNAVTQTINDYIKAAGDPQKEYFEGISLNDLAAIPLQDLIKDFIQKDIIKIVKISFIEITCIKF